MKASRSRSRTARLVRPHDLDRHARHRGLDRPRSGRDGEAHPRAGRTGHRAAGLYARLLPRRGGPARAAPTMQVTGEESSGEVEFVLVKDAGETYVGIASDHTDRQVETYGITVSKQMCDKPCSNTLWRLSDVAGHWDELLLRSYATIDGERVLYQQGKVTAMRAPQDLLDEFARRDGRFVDGTAMLCGTLAAFGGIQPGGALRHRTRRSDPAALVAHAMQSRRCPWSAEAVFLQRTRPRRGEWRMAHADLILETRQPHQVVQRLHGCQRQSICASGAARSTR